jgi:DNA-directed RNA polymerase specialized sigma24 family protein
LEEQRHTLPLPCDDPTVRDRKTLLSDKALISALGAHVRTRVPSADADDVVQSVLADALSSDGAPDEPEALRKWLFGVARHKIADFYRRNRREQPSDVEEKEAPSSGSAPAKDLLEWAEGELPPGSDAKRTFEWMLREGDGEKLESIAETEKVPAPRVRKRVSRMREHFRARWAAYVAGLAAAGLAILIAFYMFRKKPVPEAKIVPEPKPIPTESIAAPPNPVPSAIPTTPPSAMPTTSASAIRPVPTIVPTATSAPPRPRTTSMTPGGLGSGSM